MKCLIPLKAISVNKVWQGKRFKTKDYEQFEEDCFKLIRKQKMIKGEVQINYKFFIKSYALTDVDNLIKPIQDIIVKCGFIEDDRKVKYLTAEKFKSKEERIEINIVKYD